MSFSIFITAVNLGRFVGMLSYASYQNKSDVQSGCAERSHFKLPSGDFVFSVA